MPSSEKGFSLIELLIALAIFALSTTAFASGLLSTLRANRLANQTTQAAAIAQSQLETFPTLNESPAQISGTIFSRQTQVTQGSPTAGARTVTVIVSWVDGGTRAVTLRSIF